MIALIITSDGFPLAYEVMEVDPSDRTTLRGFLEKIEKTCGKAKRTCVMDLDRGFPLEEVLEDMRKPGRERFCREGAPKGKIKYEKEWLDLLARYQNPNKHLILARFSNTPRTSVLRA